MKFKDLINNCKEQKGIIYTENIEIVNENKNNEYYIDSRTKRENNNVQELNNVYPFAYFNGHYWYICPDCGCIHASEYLGKIQTGCCSDIDCERHTYHKGNYYSYKRQPIILEEYEGNDEI